LTTVAATTDSWTAKSLRKSFINLTVVFLKEDWTPDSIELDVYNLVGKHTAKNLAEKLMSIFKNFGIEDKITTLVSDNAANMKLLGEIRTSLSWLLSSYAKFNCQKSICLFR